LIQINTSIVHFCIYLSASKFGYTNIVKILIQAGAALDIGDINGQTALMGGK
jgi:ankyrin repeat protein